MTNNRTTEPQRCPFCGDKAVSKTAWQREDGAYFPAACGCHRCGIWRYGDSNYGHGGFATEDDRKKSMEQAVSRWNTRMMPAGDPDAREVFYNLQLNALYYIRATLAELCETTDESFDSLFAFTNGIAATYERLFLEGAPTSIGEATSRIDSITMRVNEIHK